MPNEPINPEDQFPGGDGNFGQIHIIGPNDLPPHLKEQLFGKMYPGEVEKKDTPPKFLPVDTTDMIIMNNLGTWMKQMVITGYREDGLPILEPVLGDKNRERANRVFGKMVERMEKYIELKNDGTL